MIFRITFLVITLMISDITDSDLEKYLKLENNNVASVKKSDLPSEFSDEAFKVVDEFIRKTADLNYEILIYFDYTTGEILKCKIGSTTNVKLNFEKNEFSKHSIASIHNHTKDMYTPPSDKNFGILSRDWEKYELIAGVNGLWILKCKIINEKLNFELKLISKIYFKIALTEARSKFDNIQKIDDECDEIYGKLLSKYINDKKLNSIQLTKKEYHHDKKY